MTVSSIVPVNNHTGNSSAKKFDFDFLIEDEKELIVQHINEYGVISTLTLGVDYSINEIGNASGSYIIFPLETSQYNILKSSEKISLMLTLPIKQESEFKNSSYFNLNVLEWTFDYIVRILQIFSRQIDRCIKVNEGSETTSDDLIKELNDSKNIAVVAAQNAETAANQVIQNKNTIIQNIEVFNQAYDDCLQSILDEGIETRSNCNLSNLSATGEKHFLNKTQITNCILEIPQNVVVEENPNLAGGYIVKAGSKAYKPDGTYYTLTQDYPIDIPNANQLVIFSQGGNYVGGTYITNCFYGPSEPTGAGSYAYWWDSTNNVIKRYINSQWTTNGYSLPILYFDENKNMHVNNGTGFIGNCQFVLPGMKYLVPNGRNEDGSLKNIEYTTNTIIRNIYEYTTDNGLQGVLLINNNYLLRYSRYYEGKKAPNLAIAMCWFDTEHNLMKYCLDGINWTVFNAAQIITSIKTSASNHTVTEMNSKQAFEACDMNDCIEQKNLISSNNLYSTLYISGNSGYRAWFKDAAKSNRVLLEQWGLSTAATNPATVTFLKSFANANINVSCTPFGNNNTSRNAYIKTRTATNMVIDSYSQGGSLDHNNGNIFWHAIGV